MPISHRYSAWTSDHRARTRLSEKVKLSADHAGCELEDSQKNSPSVMYNLEYRFDKGADRGDIGV